MSAGKVILDISISLDGIMAVTDNYQLHEWYFNREAGESIHVINELLRDTGAIIMGRKNYDLGDQFDGFMDNPYQVPHFVLSHSTPQNLPKGDTTFVFVSDGIESALNQASAVAGGRNIIIAGGANTAQQYIKSGMLDEIHIHLVPVILGEGLRLFEYIGQSSQSLECIMVKNTPSVTHLRYRMI